MSTNISKQKRDALIEKITALRLHISKAEQDENTGNLLTYLSELEKEIKGKKYGLVFEEHREGIDDVLISHTPVLSEEQDLLIDNGGQMHFLIEGDNLAALQLLQKTHRGKIDYIYIDPPYNTGGIDFRYDDTIIAKEDGFRHSKWLSFMQKRLEIAKRLLSENGLIFISIDDIELSPLTLLCDSIFGEGNRVETIVWKSKYGAGAKTVGFISVHEYILCYSSNPVRNITSELNDEGQQSYKLKDDKFERRGGYLTQPLMTTSLGDRPNLVYDIEHDGTIIHPRKQWVWSKERLEQAIANNDVVFNLQKDGSYSVRAKKYLYDEQGNIRRGKPLSVMTRPLTQDGTEEIRRIFGTEDVFKFSKPSELVRFLITLEVNDESNKSFTVLDFFAGSGTTGEAVMNANVKDNGDRRFILCTNNENNICRDVTYERIKWVLGQEAYLGSLKYYKIDYIPISERVYYEYADELLLHIRELVELENGINFTGNAEIAIVLTDEEMEAFIDNVDEYEKCCRLYRGHDILLSAEQEAKLQERDIAVCVIPDYYYRELEGGK